MNIKTRLSSVLLLGGLSTVGVGAWHGAAAAEACVPDFEHPCTPATEPTTTQWPPCPFERPVRVEDGSCVPRDWGAPGPTTSAPDITQPPFGGGSANLTPSWVPELGHTTPDCAADYRPHMQVWVRNPESTPMHLVFEDATQSGSKLTPTVSPGNTWTHDVYTSTQLTPNKTVDIYTRFSNFTWDGTSEHVDGPITVRATVPAGLCTPKDVPTTTVSPPVASVPVTEVAVPVPVPPPAETTVVPPEETTPPSSDMPTTTFPPTTAPRRVTTTAPSSLPVTGGDHAGPVLVGIGAALLGAVVVLATRRRAVG